MAICRLVSSFPTATSISVGRAERSNYLGPNIYALSKAQVRLGEELHVICRGNGSNENIDGIMVHRVRPPYNLTLHIKLLRLQPSTQFHILHTHAANAYTVGLTRHLLGGERLVVHVHGTTFGAAVIRGDGSPNEIWSRWTSRGREAFIWRRADRLIAVSKNIRDELILGYGVSPDKVKIVHNGVDTDLFRPLDQREELRKTLGWKDSRVVLFVGQLSPRKGLNVLIRASRIVADRVRNVKVVIAGGVPTYQESSTRNYVSYLRQWSEKLGLGNIVSFLGPVPNSELPKIYSAADIFVLPSFYEGLPKSMLEAMACGKACIATDLSGIAAVLTDDLGVRIPPGDAVKLADSMIFLLNEPGTRNELGKRARDKAVRELTWDGAARRLQEIYTEIL